MLIEQDNGSDNITKQKTTITTALSLLSILKVELKNHPHQKISISTQCNLLHLFVDFKDIYDDT